MLTETTVTKLRGMRLSVMAKAFKEQFTDPDDPDMVSLCLEDRFELIMDQEWANRKNNHLKCLIKNAGFAESGDCVENIEYHTDRNLNKAQIARLATCNYTTTEHTITSFLSEQMDVVKPILPVRLVWLLCGISIR